MECAVRRFVASRWSLSADELAVNLEPLGGGLESTVAVARVAATGGAHATPVPPFVVKQLPPAGWREVEVYELLWRHLQSPPAPRMFGADRSGDTQYLYLEALPSPSGWPWSETRTTAAVCRSLAQLHDATSLPHATFTWDYESMLIDSAASTLDLAWRTRDAAGHRIWPRCGDLRRVVHALPDLRRAVLGAGMCVIHGDVHPGNVFVHDNGTGPVVFIDWSRARLGSPLEDVAAWLHSLGCWEHDARRRHDTLLRAYLACRRIATSRLTPELRRRYWFASACNGLAGAIRYHIAMIGDSGSSEAGRQMSRQALAAWTRVIRRTAALLGTSPDR